MWWTSVPWKADKNKTAPYFDSHQVALILDCQKFTPWPGHCQSTGFNESHRQQSTGALRNADRKTRNLLDGEESADTLDLQCLCTKTLCSSRCSRVHQTTDMITIISLVWPQFLLRQIRNVIPFVFPLVPPSISVM